MVHQFQLTNCQVDLGFKSLLRQKTNQMLPTVGLDPLKALLDWSLDADGDSFWMLKLCFSQMFSFIN